MATLAWEGRRAEFFRKELIAALRVLDGGHITPGADDRQLGRRHGPAAIHADQFRALAVDFDGDGRRDIWDSRADALASIAHYFARIRLAGGRALGPRGAAAGRLQPRSAPIPKPPRLREWGRLGFRRTDGGPLPASELEAALVLPERGAGQVFLGHHNLAGHPALQLAR